MGIVDSAIARRTPRLHAIVEAHPQVQQRAEEFAASRPRTVVIHGRWQNDAVQAQLASLAPFDGIFFDT